MDKRTTSLYCIISNLLAGNAIVFFWSLWGGGINWDLMIGMSFSCILSYRLVFRYINFEEWGYLRVLLLSLLTCVVIELVGCSFAGVVRGIGLGDNLFQTLITGLVTGFFLGIVGNMLMFPITIVMGAANLFWFRKYQRAKF